jgi:hypothetical protein
MKHRNERRKKVDTEPVVHALIASFLALSVAGGKRYMGRAGEFLRDLSFDPAVDPRTAKILQDILSAVDHDSDCEVA